MTAPKTAKEIERVPLEKLLLDETNPRFGYVDQTGSQAGLLDLIVEKFGVEDVLGSIAANGYFDAEPLVCKPAKEGSYVVAEGNRRLTACLILANDPRAKNQATLGQRYREIWNNHEKPPIDPVPVIVFEDHDNQALLSYLGVRHIAAAQPWDSYAKAAWVAKIVETGGLTVEAVAEMIGDQHRTVLRLLEGYHFIQQLIEEDVFRPEDSQRRGRGSVTEYPFSWVYTLLGYKAARAFIGLGDQTASPRPVPKKKIGDAKLVVTAMFGDKSRGQSAAIDDSRELSLLADTLADPEKVALLRKGRRVEEIETLTRPLNERLEQGLLEIRDLQQALVTGLAEAELDAATAAVHVPSANKSRNLAQEIERRLKGAADGDA